MNWHIGDFFRALGGKFGALFKHTKGISVDLGDHKIHLSEGHGINRTDPPQFNKPHKPEPPRR